MQKSSVEADVLEVIVLVVVAYWLDKWQRLLHIVAAAKLHFSHHAELKGLKFSLKTLATMRI